MAEENKNTQDENDDNHPLILVKTWIFLIQSTEHRYVRDRASKMLIEEFGDIQSAIAFAKRHNIIV